MDSTLTDDDLIKELNELIQLDYEASLTYEEALQQVEDEQARSALHAFMQDHLQHITDLRSVINELGGTPIEPSRDLKGVLLEGMTKLRNALGTLSALKAMRLNEKLTNRSYEKASELDLPSRARHVVAASFHDERRHLAAIRAHIARVRAGAEEADDDDDDEGKSVDQGVTDVQSSVRA